MEGFGTSAWGMDGKLWISTYAGHLQCLHPGAESWDVVTHLKEDRFFHRMLPYEDTLILVGGASMRAGKRLSLETVILSELK